MTFNPSPHPVTCPCSWCAGSVEPASIPAGTPIVAAEMTPVTRPTPHLDAVKAERDKALDDRDWWKQAAESAQLLADEIASTNDLLREELASARQALKHLEEHQEIRARVVRERNAERELLRAELVSARQENAQLRRLPQPDNQNGGPA